jgi:beta-glucanase (GH16 family)
VEAQSQEFYQYGVFSSRLRSANCEGQTNAGVVTGFFTYFNDGNDHNGDDLADNSEIDFEWLCAAPEFVYMTMWTDYRGSDEAHKRVTRLVNLRTGAIEHTCYGQTFDDCEPLTGAAAQPSELDPMPDFDPTHQYYEYGFEWQPDHVTWWLRKEAEDVPIVLWDYRGPADRIPSLAAYYNTNVWHTSNWPPPGYPDAVETPTASVSAWVDWTRYSP